MYPSGVSNIRYEERRGLNEDAKAAIARACAARIPADASVFLNIGTSTEAVARALLSHKNLLIFTNNLNVANISATNPDCEVVVTGGTLRRSDGGLVGSQTMRMVEEFKFDYAVMGCSAIDEDGDMLLFQWGTGSWHSGLFGYGLTRQFIAADAEDDDIWQLSVTSLFSSSSETAACGSGDRWCHRPSDLDEFTRFVESVPATEVVSRLQPTRIEVRLEQAW